MEKVKADDGKRRQKESTFTSYFFDKIPETRKRISSPLHIVQDANAFIDIAIYCIVMII